MKAALLAGSAISVSCVLAGGFVGFMACEKVSSLEKIACLGNDLINLKSLLENSCGCQVEPEDLARRCRMIEKCKDMPRDFLTAVTCIVLSTIVFYWLVDFSSKTTPSNAAPDQRPGSNHPMQSRRPRPPSRRSFTPFDLSKLSAISTTPRPSAKSIKPTSSAAPPTPPASSLSTETPENSSTMTAEMRAERLQLHREREKRRAEKKQCFSSQ